ncbi:DUF3265 domain-containing protein [Vibrio vulnificus]|nr:DUF3265 domain-containing protein [Vibrio vulnificus]MBH9767444.1 DUF3265 domain-containing protein [Vibrio vulnificus]MBH9775679.1 DUF3265 domain-containing protein [Vibrio vulnificus]MBH9783803.1 DUF3265 domain-containing protein [Vibrio vulnificus]MBH9868526.1 DUF3265 domain-containing protein [Vibrio vulnificus]
MTRRSRGIHAAWHFWYAVVFGGESGLRKVVLGGIHPLTRRYVFFQHQRIYWCWSLERQRQF